MRKSFSRPSCCVAIILCSLMPNVCADSILGFAVMAGLSHQLNILRIGQELAVRGHNFSMLLSSTDAISIDALRKKSFPGLDVVTFEGPVHVGTEAWASSLSRDPQEVPRRTPTCAATLSITSRLTWGCSTLQSAAQLFKSQALAAGHLFADKQALGRMSDTGLLSACALRSSCSARPYTYCIQGCCASHKAGLTRPYPTGYDLILRDAVMWPAALLEDLLGIPSVEVIPLPLSSMYSESQSVPNPISYIPQLGTSLTPKMVRGILHYIASL
jgi:hypothetical protein